MRGGLDNAPSEWYIKVMWWDKTGNSKSRFVQDPRAGPDKHDWCLCASVDTELTLNKVLRSRSFQLTKGSCKKLEERCKSFCTAANRRYKPVLVRTEERDEGTPTGNLAATPKKKRIREELPIQPRKLRQHPRTATYTDERSSCEEGSTDDSTFRPRADQESSSEESSSGREG